MIHELNNTHVLEHHAVCLLVTAKWAELSDPCLEVFQATELAFNCQKVLFVHHDYDQDYDSQSRELLSIKAAPLWRLTLNEKVTFEQYGGLLTVAQLKAFIHSYLL